MKTRFYVTTTRAIELQYTTDNGKEWKLEASYHLQADPRNNLKVLVNIVMLEALQHTIDMGYKYIGICYQEKEQ